MREVAVRPSKHESPPNGAAPGWTSYFDEPRLRTPNNSEQAGRLLAIPRAPGCCDGVVRRECEVPFESGVTPRLTPTTVGQSLSADCS